MPETPSSPSPKASRAKAASSRGTTRIGGARHRISIHLTGANAAELNQLARAAESAGVESIWASELYTDPWIQLACVAAQTHSITLGTGIALGFVRSPMSLATAAMDLERLTRQASGEGRFILGLGAGVKRLNEAWHGVAQYSPPAAHMRELIEFLRVFFSQAHTGAPIRYSGRFIQTQIEGFKRPGSAPQTPIPIYLAANQPQMLELAGELADGVLAHLFISPKQLKEVVLPRIGAGLERGARSRNSLTLSAGITVAIDSDAKTARHHAKGPLAFYACVRSYQNFFEYDGFGEEVRAIQAAFKRGERESLVNLVSDAMVDTYCAAGTPDQVLKRLSEYDELLDIKGVSAPRHHCPEDAHRHYQEQIFKYL